MGTVENDLGFNWTFPFKDEENLLEEDEYQKYQQCHCHQQQQQQQYHQ
jgi:hypothetical protein